MAETQAQVGQEQSGPGPAETGTGGDQQAHVGTAAPQLAPAAAVAALATAAPSAAAPSRGTVGAAQSAAAIG